MAEQNYSKEELWKIYKMLPEDLKTAIFSAETAENISLACTIAGIKDKRVSEVARYTGRVLMGLLSPKEFVKVLEEKVGIEPDRAKRVAHQITRLVFNPVKESLTVLYEEERPEIPGVKWEPVEKVLPEEKPKKQDIYREPIE